ncbi:RRP12-like protein [Cotesia glomerata]|uniref:RRP12-like protein n=1 Tax=Cotesia glomerata TaxID=32391 RepID=A0AAV7ISE1_COTGL|nr:RRP12-like protein [Cotesia glomerata]KAH0557965.1 hypothetical protein KQX54_013298 [Cotesia glomerata]
MGKLRPRAPTRKGAKRWPKGQSSNSNPETKKYRNQARSGFGQPTLGPSRLTTEAVKRLDALQGLEPSEKIEIDNDFDDASSTADTFKTFGTFASNYSNCSNTSFSRFLTHFQSTSLIHKEMLAILTAVTEVIKQNGGTESSTEYYAALMTTLEQAYSNESENSASSSESIAAILSLLGMGLKTVPKNVLKAQFSQASKVFIQILERYIERENYLIIRHCIGCLSVLLRAQEAITWSNSSTMQILYGILSLTIHSKPKVRKAAQHAVCAILKGSELMKENPPAYHPAAPEIAKHCLKQFEDAGKPGTITSTLHILTLLKDIIHQLPKTYVKSICEGLLRIMVLKNVLISSCCLQTFHSLFISKPTESILPSKLNAQIINALHEIQPNRGDTQLTLAWLAVMQEAHVNLSVNSLNLCAANIHQIIQKATELWLSDKPEIITAASHTVKTLLQVCVAPLCESENTARKYEKTIREIILLIRSGMQLRYNSAWHHILHLLAVLFQIAGVKCQNDLAPILSDLCELRDTHKFTYNSEVEFAVGAAVKAMGPEKVLEVIPLVTSHGIFDLKRSWLLPVLKDCISTAPLSYFKDILIPLATNCEKLSLGLKAKNDGIMSHSYGLLTSQIWSLLPNFCNNPPDIEKSFKEIARILGTILSEKKDLRIFVMTALRRLITRSVENDKKEDIKTLANYSKNYLPLLFSFYTTQPKDTVEEGQRLAAFDTIKAYLSITPPELCKELLNTALTKLQSEENDYSKQALFSLIRILVQFTDQERLLELYNKCVVIFKSTKQPKEQKQAYKFLEEILGSEKEICKEFVQENYKAIQKVLIGAATSVCTISRASRLRCIDYLIKYNQQLEKIKFLEAIVPEVVMCVKDVKAKCRTLAYQVLNNIADRLLDKGDSFDKYIQIIVAGLGSNPAFIHATLLSLASLTYKYTGSIGISRAKEILELTCTLLTGPAREIVLSALCYVKVYLSAFPTAIIGPDLQSIMKGITGMTEDCKRHFRQKVRDILTKLIRKFGIEPISELIPQSDEIMHKRIKNIRKIEARKQKIKEERKKGEDSDEEFSVKRKPKSIEDILADSDEDFDDTDNDGGDNKKKQAPKIWIKENEDDIMDFTDPAAMRNITSSKPGSANLLERGKLKNRGFKTDDAGRLIIKDSDDESEEEKVGKKKKQLPFLGEDSDDDPDKDDDEDDGKSGSKFPRKRKLSGSTDAGSVATSVASKSVYKPGGSGIHRPLKSAKLDKTLGAEYRSKKAAGDVKKKGKPDPYAYVPLTRASLNRRKKMKNASRFKGVISGAKKGAQMGKKARRKM